MRCGRNCGDYNGGVAGSDLRELCTAAMYECVAEEEEGGGGGGNGLRVLNVAHFQAACRWMVFTCWSECFGSDDYDNDDHTIMPTMVVMMTMPTMPWIVMMIMTAMFTVMVLMFVVVVLGNTKTYSTSVCMFVCNLLLHPRCSGMCALRVLPRASE